MSRVSPLLLAVLCWVASVLATPTVYATTTATWDRSQQIDAWCGSDMQARFDRISGVPTGVIDLDASERQWLYAALRALNSNDMICLDDSALIPIDGGWLDILDGRTFAERPEGGASPFLNLPLRRVLDPAVHLLAVLVDDAPAQRRQSAQQLRSGAVTPPLELIEEAVAGETDAAVLNALQRLFVEQALRSDDPALRIDAIEALASDPTRRNRNLIRELLEDDAAMADPLVREATERAEANIAFWLQVSDALTIAYHGLSYGSVLFMAALGLAIIFGLMGVINLAQGEFIMLGAYMTWFTQEILKVVAPEVLDYYLLIAIPFAFLGPALVGMALEWGVIRHLYQRPLLTLLATWAISLLLINLVRVLVGTQNLNFHTPDYLRSGFTVVAEFSVTWTRMLSMAFALATLLVTLFILYRTRFGLRLRATTQNRRMSRCVGVSTRWTDAMAFAFGSGLAGLSGLALSTMYNVNPTMGTSLIIDSFIVVVVGGVGSVLGTAVAALGIGQMNAIIEPIYGAVAAKVIVLLAVILFIQQKPNGLFPRKGRR